MARGLEIRHKRDFHYIRWTLWALILVLIVIGGWLGYRYFTHGELPLGVTVKALEANPGVDETDITQNQVDAHAVAPNLPRYISIPSLNIANARVFSAGVDENNQLGAPNNINDTVWYDKSAEPGAGYGAVLINGHNGGVTKNGVFAEIKDLKTGDKIVLERGDGKMIIYKVVENHSMALDEVNSTVMEMMAQSAQKDKEGLNLITYDGKWVPQIKQYDRRIMLRAVAI